MSTRVVKPYNETQVTQLTTKLGDTFADIDAFLETIPPECRKPDLVPVVDEVDRIYHRFQILMMLLCEGLEQRNTPAVKIFRATRLNLLRLAKEIEVVGINKLRAHIRDQYLLHPYRRIPSANWIITQASADPKLSLLENFRWTSNQCLIWHHEVEHPDRVFEDPDLLPKEVFEGLLTQIKQSSEAKEQCCVLCDSLYTFSPRTTTSTTSPPTSHSAIRTPCNHEFCYSCLLSWRLEALSGRFSCPMCRLCLACGESNCRLHEVDAESTRPFPFKGCFEAHFEGKKAVSPPPYYGVGLTDVRRIRELTRRFRVEYAYFYNKKEDPAAAEKDKENAGKRLERVRKDIHGMIGYILRHIAGGGDAPNEGSDSGSSGEESDDDS
ncbi:hypothetical protein K458DRAFT_486885 [Lentithecium fluviatile CBS 122367]|uniref:RING-type domain-containing protein n=1 Tax=Lentithecium fluviatile CBS 122367 TaxID=1168545 RepID=A0A6G1J427_9PLEO|nr:hypothetical protein K458DRAFT_486885 [Lentithecium fluviatile CBS 122367]